MRDPEFTTDPVRNLGAAAAAADPLKEQLRENNEVLRAVQLLNRSDLSTLAQGNKYAFSLDPATRRPTVKLVDEVSGNVLYQIPPAEVLRAAAKLRREMARSRERPDIIDGFKEQ